MLTLVAVLVMSLVLIWAVRRVEASNKTVVDALNELRLNSRARVRTMSVQSGARTEEQELVRVGRATRSKLVVFGGDPHAPQHTNLGGTIEEGVPQ